MSNKMPNDKYVVIAGGSDADHNTVIFFSITPKMPENEALAYLEWIKQGPNLKRAIECKLYENDNVEHVYFTLEKI